MEYCQVCKEGLTATENSLCIDCREDLHGNEPDYCVSCGRVGYHSVYCNHNS